MVATGWMLPSTAAAQGHTGTFRDDDGVYYEAAFEALAAQGILDGTECASDRICPDDPMKRSTMAVWLGRALTNNEPGRINSNRFSDVNPADWQAAHIERFAQLGITAGCGLNPLRYCPDGHVSRGQMAAFFLNAFNLPYASSAGFTDTANHIFEEQIDALAAAGITAGCASNPRRFCPDQTVLRGQMAAFLYGAINGLRPPATEAVPDFALEATPGPVPSLESAFNLRPLEVKVYYCGSNSTYDIDAAVELLERRVDDFYQRQSGYNPSAPASGSNIKFSSGKVLTPSGVQWNTDTINAWGSTKQKVWEARGSAHGVDPCMHAAIEDSSRQSLIIADIALGGTNGYAWVKDGPALVGTPTRLGGSINYLATVAHELGHAFYAWHHPWHEEELDFDHEDPEEQKKYAYELSAIMSWPWREFNRKQDLREGSTDEAYVACRQRDRHSWVAWIEGDETCDILGPPDTPGIRSVTPGDGMITVSWTVPANNGQAITDYDLRYFAAGDDNWTRWQPDSVSISTQATIQGLTNGATYYVSVRAENELGNSEWSPRVPVMLEQDSTMPVPTVVVRPGDPAQGEQGADGTCKSVHCRWLHVEIENFGPGPHTLVCAHNGIEQAGIAGGAYDSDRLSVWPATRSCLFGYPGSEVFAIVGAELRDGIWYGGVYSEPVEWPYSHGPDPAYVNIEWGSDASSRSSCPPGQRCLNLSYEIVGLGSAPYDLECWGNGQKLWEGRWSGREHTGCYYWGDTAQVVVNGVRSNTINFVAHDGQDREVRISWGMNASDRSNCSGNTRCRYLNYEFIGDWDPPDYNVECWGNGRLTADPFSWSGRPHTSCYYSSGTAYAIVDGVRSNTIDFVAHDGQDREVRISWGMSASDRSNCSGNTRCRYLNYEFIGDWDPPDYNVECWGNGRLTADPFSWSGRPHTSCYYSSGTAYAIVDGVRSNTITYPSQEERELA